MNVYNVKVIREAGKDPITNRFAKYEEEILEIKAENEKQAFIQSQFKSTIQFQGQLRRTLINGKEYFKSY